MHHLFPTPPQHDRYSPPTIPLTNFTGQPPARFTWDCVDPVQVLATTHAPLKLRREAIVSSRQEIVVFVGMPACGKEAISPPFDSDKFMNVLVFARMMRVTAVRKVVFLSKALPARRVRAGESGAHSFTTERERERKREN
jgi:hypothetical protein